LLYSIRIYLTQPYQPKIFPSCFQTNCLCFDFLALPLLEVKLVSAAESTKYASHRTGVGAFTLSSVKAGCVKI
jgi:hypothetical protein